MTTVRISATIIASWLNANYLNSVGQPLICVSYPPVIPDAPDELVIVTLLPSASFDYEKAFEIRNFQVRCRCIQNNPNIAEANSVGIDTLLNSLMMPWNPAPNCHVIDLGWTGGGPAPMAVADDFANRYSWVCTYYCKVATGF